MKLISNKRTLPNIHYGDDLTDSANFNSFSAATKVQIAMRFAKTGIVVISKTQAKFATIKGDHIKTDLFEQKIRRTVGFKRGHVDIIIKL